MVTSGKTTGTQIMNNAYTYDRVDNVLSVSNSAPLPSAGGMGGQMTHTYSYDGLYRLKSATGTYTGTDKKTAGYTLEMAYDNLHNIVSKKQHVQQNGIQFDGTLKAGYDLNYTYSSENPHQIKNIKDVNYRTENKDAQDVTKKEHDYQYDKNGNLIYVNTAREKKDAEKDVKANERKLKWDEENRLQAIDDNGFVSNYWYDAAGERTVKTSGESEHIYVNSVFSGGYTQTANFTAYISPYIVISQGGQYTKHIYIGSQRIVSKLGDLDSYGADPRRIEYAGTGVDGAKVDYKTKYQTAQQEIKDRYAYFEVPYNGIDNDDYVNGQGFCCDNLSNLRSVNPSENDNPELFQYYYHSDHLGSSSLITNLDGEIVQHIEYVPFGEVFIEERNSKWNTPYLFNAKELDEETGLYYYGARYYDPRTSLWLSTDLQQEKYLNWSPYHYSHNNPIKYIDPDGEAPIAGNITGALIGAFTEYAGIVGAKMLFEGMSFTEANKNLTWRDGMDIAFSAAIGAATGTIDGGISKFATWAAKPSNQKILVQLLKVGASALESSIKEIWSEGDFDFTSVLSSTLAEIGLGHLLKSDIVDDIAQNAKTGVDVATKRLKDLSGRKTPHERLIRNAKDEVSNQKSQYIFWKGANTIQESIEKTGGNVVKEATKQINETTKSEETKE